MRKSTLAALAASIVVATASLGSAAPAFAAGSTSVKTENGWTKVKAPYTRVDITAQRTKVRVNAPHANVSVETGAGHVRIRVPYYSGDIRW